MTETPELTRPFPKTGGIFRSLPEPPERDVESSLEHEHFSLRFSSVVAERVACFEVNSCQPQVFTLGKSLRNITGASFVYLPLAGAIFDLHCTRFSIVKAAADNNFSKISYLKSKVEHLEEYY